MATFNGASMTSGPVKQLHAGLNVAIADYSQTATISAAGQINMLRLPAGAQVTDVALRIDGVPGTGLAIKDSHGNIYMSTATHAGALLRGTAVGGFGNRLTSSAFVYIEQNGVGIAAQAGADSADYKLMVSYLSELDGD